MEPYLRLRLWHVNTAAALWLLVWLFPTTATVQSEAFFQHLAELTVALEGTYGDEGSAIQQAGHDIIERVAARQIVTIREGDGIVDRTAPERR